MKHSERDLNILALTLYGEARGESYEGKVGVAWSARNRATADLWSDDRNDWWGEGIAGVCLRSWQYSCWNRSDQPQSQRERLGRFLVGNDVMRGILKTNARADDDLEACWRVARAVLDGYEPDPTCGSTHYYLEGSPEPSWARARGRPCGLGGTCSSTTSRTGTSRRPGRARSLRQAGAPWGTCAPSASMWMHSKS